jgi:hypothetical protein
MADTYSPKSHAKGVTSEGGFVPDELLVAVELAEKRTIASGAGVVLRGTVLGKITASGKLVPSLSAANDGSQVPYAVLATGSVDATSADADATVYIVATLNSNALIFGTGHTAATVYDPLRNVGINLVKSMKY